jgi:hypothetical protein
MYVKKMIKWGLFVCGLFNDAFSVIQIVVSNEGVMSEWWIGKDEEGSGHDLILK